MPKVSKQNAKHDDYGPVESWHEEVGEHAIEFVTFKHDVDSTPMLKGLPNDQCHCPHWGYVLKGRVTFTVDGQEEVISPVMPSTSRPGTSSALTRGPNTSSSAPPRRWPRSSNR